VSAVCPVDLEVSSQLGEGRGKGRQLVQRHTCQALIGWRDTCQFLIGVSIWRHSSRCIGEIVWSLSMRSVVMETGDRRARLRFVKEFLS
jgi:hypothetical protein